MIAFIFSSLIIIIFLIMQHMRLMVILSRADGLDLYCLLSTLY